MKLLIVGGSLFGIALAKRMMENGVEVSIIENRPQKIIDLEASLDEYEGAQVFAGDATSYTVLKEAGAGDIAAAAVFTGKDILNSLITQKLRKLFDVEKVITVVESDHFKTLLENEGITAVSILDTMVDSMVWALEKEQPVSHPEKKSKTSADSQPKPERIDTEAYASDGAAHEVEYIGAHDELSSGSLESDEDNGNGSEEL